MKKRRISLRAWLSVLVLVPYTALMSLLAMLMRLFSKRRGSTLVMQWWARSIAKLYGVRLNIRGVEHVDSNRPAIYMANHSSMVDIPVLIVALAVDLRFIFKQSLLWAPLVGQAIYLMGMVPINRSNKAKAAESLRKAGRQIRGGKHILIFPEGTRARKGLLKFKRGGFYLAIHENIPIVPISISNSQELGGRNSALVNPGQIDVVIHPAIDMEPYEWAEREAVIDRVQTVIASDLKGPRYEGLV